MTEMIELIAAGADIRPPQDSAEVPRGRKWAGASELVETLPVHHFPSEDERNSATSCESGQTVGEDTTSIDETSVEEERRRRIYRGRTVGMLRRYMRYSIETGRLPSVLGREFFRAKVTSYTVVTFEDRVIFVHDMETCLHRLDDFSQRVLARIVLQEYGQEEAARLLGCARMTVHRVLLEALDRLSDILVSVGLLELLPASSGKCCQGGKTGPFSVSDCDESE